MAAEGVEGRLHLRIQLGSQIAPCSITPMRSSGKRSSTPSKIIVASVCMGGPGIAHVVDRAEVLVAAVEVGRDRQAVLEVVGSMQVAGAADVEDDRDAGLLGLGPHRVERRCGSASGRAGSRTATSSAAAPMLDRLGGHRRGALEVGAAARSRWGAAAVVDRAELEHAAVVGAGDAVGEVEIVAVLPVVAAGCCGRC